MDAEKFIIKTGDLNIDLLNQIFDLFMQNTSYTSFYDMLINELNQYIIGITDLDAPILEISLIFKSEAHYTWFLMEYS